MPLLIVGQNQTKLIITSVLKTDRTFTRIEELLLENRVTKNRVIYIFDSSSQKFVTNKYVVENYFNVSNGDSTMEKQLTKNKRWKNKFILSDFMKLQNALETNIDTIAKGFTMHTSHHYLHIYIEIITNGDTLLYSKTKPFEVNTSWRTNKNASIVNPEIDRQIALLIPNKFLGREKLILMPSSIKKKEGQ